jgi:two-component system, NarL family, response regulator NreC
VTVIDIESPAVAGRRVGAPKLGVLLALFDLPILNAGFRAVIDAELDMQVVGEIDEPEALGAYIEKSGADIVITEYLPFSGRGRSTIEPIEVIRAARPEMKILALACGGTCGGSGEQFSLALKAGAHGYLTREAQASDVVSAIRSVAHGQTYVSPAMVTSMVNTYLLRTSPGSMGDPYDLLSEREREVLLLAALGHTNREIAKTFHLSEQTVHNYRAAVMEKLGFHDRVELLKFAIRRGLIDVADL